LDGVRISGYVYVCPICDPDKKSIDHDIFFDEFCDWVESKGYIFEGVTVLEDMDQ
jgi:hypothetical protein